MNRRQFCLSALASALSACSSSFPPALNRQIGTNKAYIVHGYSATPADHWFPWLASRLQTEGIAADIIPLPNSSRPDFERWQETLAAHIGKPQPGDLFIAHSLGTISLLHYLSRLRPPRIAGLVLVSGFGTRLPALPSINGYNIDAYVDKAVINYAAIRQMSPAIYSVISENDTIVAPVESLKLARRLDSKIISVPNGGHFLAQDGFTEMPQAWQAIESLLPALIR